MLRLKRPTMLTLGLVAVLLISLIGGGIFISSKISPTPSSSPSPSTSPTESPTPSPTASSTSSATKTPTAKPKATATPKPSVTATPTSSTTPTPSPTSSPTPTPNLSMEPSKTTTVGQTFTITLKMNTGSDQVTAAEIHLSFDKTKLEVQSISAGPFLPIVLATPPPNSSDGTTSITLGSSPSGPASGTGDIATVTLKALDTGSTNFIYTSSTQTASVGKSGNSLNATSGSTISISNP